MLRAAARPWDNAGFLESSTSMLPPNQIWTWLLKGLDGLVGMMRYQHSQHALPDKARLELMNLIEDLKKLLPPRDA